MSGPVQYDLFGNPIEEKPKIDWRGDTHSVFVTVGASNHSKGERQNEDFYASHPSAGEWLMRLEKFNGPIWECCAGQGHLSKVFEAHGYEVRSTDLIDRGYGPAEDSWITIPVSHAGRTARIGSAPAAHKSADVIVPILSG